MKVIIAGSRDIKLTAMEIDKYVTESNLYIDTLVCGCTPGVDQSGKNWAKVKGIYVEECPAKWGDLSQPDAVIRINKKGKKYDAKAGSRRDKELCKFSDAIILIWDGEDKLGKRMLKLAKEYKLIIREFII